MLNPQVSQVVVAYFSFALLHVQRGGIDPRIHLTHFQKQSVQPGETHTTRDLAVALCLGLKVRANQTG